LPGVWGGELMPGGTKIKWNFVEGGISPTADNLDMVTDHIIDLVWTSVSVQTVAAYIRERGPEVVGWNERHITEDWQRWLSRNDECGTRNDER
jgi:hypothetical protein